MNVTIFYQEIIVPENYSRHCTCVSSVHYSVAPVKAVCKPVLKPVSIEQNKSTQRSLPIMHDQFQHNASQIIGVT